RRRRAATSAADRPAWDRPLPFVSLSNRAGRRLSPFVRSAGNGDAFELAVRSADAMLRSPPPEADAGPRAARFWPFRNNEVHFPRDVERAAFRPLRSSEGSF